LTDPGLDCTPVCTGDYNGDGKADILLQNTDGTRGCESSRSQWQLPRPTRKPGPMADPVQLKR
jgi:hypothetical protein